MKIKAICVWMKTQSIKCCLFAVCLLPVPVAATVTTTATSMTTAVPTMAVAVAGQWRASATAFARVKAYRQVTLRLPFAARITALHVEPGAHVVAGTELAHFDAPLLRQNLANWKQALLEVQLAQKHLQILRETQIQHTSTRQQRVAGEQALAQAQGKARLQWETLAASADLLHIKIERQALAKQLKQQEVSRIAQQLGSLKAPFDGLIVKRQVTLGEQLEAGSALFELEALQQVYVNVYIPRAVLTFWHKGETCRDSTLDNTVQHAAPCRTKSGLLQPVGGVPLYDARTGLWRLRFTSHNPGLLLRDGSWIVVKHFAPPRPVVWVPQAAVVSRHRQSWCMVAGKHAGDSDAYKAVAVKTGAAVDGRVPVISGLQAGDKVMTSGAYEWLYRDLKQLIKFVD